MKSRRQDVSEDRLVKSRRQCKEPSKISVNRRVYSESIPIDLVVEILSRLPVKSIARCRCLSKLWASILRRPHFRELFLTRSQARPQLLLTCHKRETRELFFFSSPQPQNSDANSSLVTTEIYHMKIPYKIHYERVLHINGLVCLRDIRIVEGRKRKDQALVSIICNPSTRQSLYLSKVMTGDWLRSYFGYDPIEKQLKVLSMTATTGAYDDYQVLTLGTKEMSWRKVECCICHSPICEAICIKGVLYYGAYVLEDTMIVCFDIRSEKFCFMNVSNDIIDEGSILVNYNGKLGSLLSDDGVDFSGTSTCVVLWILEDTEKNEWSKHIRVLPPMWKDVVGDFGFLDVVGMVGGNEIVFSYMQSLPFYVFYYNIERNTVRRVEIQGLEGSKRIKIHTFLNHVEDIKPIDGY